MVEVPADQVADLRRRIEAAPDDLGLRIELGDVLRHHNDADGARDVLHGALAIAPGSIKVLRRLAGVEQAARNWKAAELHVCAALAIKPEDDASLLDLSEILLRQLLYREAETVLRDALKSAPNHAGFHSKVGYILRHQGANAEAETHLRRAIELNPRDTAAMLE